MFVDESADQLFSMSPEAMFLVDSEMKKVMQSNKSAEQLSGMSTADLLQCKFDQVFSWSEFGYDPFSDMGKKSGAMASFRPGVLQNRKVGAIPVLASSWNVTLGKGKLAKALMVRDARPLRMLEGGQKALQVRIAELEEQLEQKSHSASAAAPANGGTDVGDLILAISRYFNDLATVIMGSAGIVRSSIGAGNVNQVHLKTIEDASNRLSTLMQQLLITVGRCPMQRVEVKLDAMFEDILKEMNLGQEGRVQLKVNIPGKSNQVIGDPKLLRQAFKNIMVNAVEAMPHGGLLSIETSSVDIDNQAGIPQGLKLGPYVRVRIADTGLGMDEVTQSKIGKPFVTTKLIANRPGLGLAVVKGVIHQHEGAYQIQSHSGKGTTVQVWLQSEIES